MNIVHYQKLPQSVTASVVSVGNFDGIHRGHELLVKEVVARAKAGNMSSVIVTFDPHTRAVVNSGGMQPVLSTIEEKAFLLSGYGVDYLAWIPFDEEFAKIKPMEFVDRILKHDLRAQEWVMGEDHTFGSQQAGDKNLLQSPQGRNHINTFAVSSLLLQDTMISSTEIRKRINEGRIADAVTMLGHPYLVSAKRVSGIKKGTKLGVPTLNFSRPTVAKVIPPPGVYAALLEYNGRKSAGALYFGNCPTFADRDFHLEFHDFDFIDDGPDVGEIGHLWVYAQVRKDQKFTSEDALVVQMNKDISFIKNFFAGERYAGN